VASESVLEIGNESAHTGDPAPPVCFEPCEEFRLDRIAVWPVCRVCGWLERDHSVVAVAVAVMADVAELPRRSTRLPERKAS